MNKDNNKKYTEYDKTNPVQLSLFSTFGGIYEADRKEYSSTVDIYDILPKYFYGNVDRLRINGKYLDIVKRDFIYQKIPMQITIKPALVEQKDGTTKAFFPGHKEEIIEDVLRKFASESYRNEMLDDQLAVRFTLYDLWRELKKVNHNYKYSEIREALEVLSNTNLRLESKNKEMTFASNMFETFGIVNENDSNQSKLYSEDNKEYNKRIVYFVRFNSLVSEGVKNNTWRLINYQQCMAYKRSISRWLHKRMSYLFKNARSELPYTINLTTIIRDSCMLNNAKFADSSRETKNALNEMVKIGSLDKYEFDNIYDETKSNKLKDVKFRLFVSDKFLLDMKKSFLKDRKEAGSLQEIPFEEELKSYNKGNYKEKIIETDNYINKKSLIEKKLTNCGINSKQINKVLKDKNEDELNNISYYIYAALEYSRNFDTNYEKISAIMKFILNKWTPHPNTPKQKIDECMEAEGLLLIDPIKEKEKLEKKKLETYGVNRYKHYKGKACKMENPQTEQEKWDDILFLIQQQISDEVYEILFDKIYLLEFPEQTTRGVCLFLENEEFRFKYHNEIHKLYELIKEKYNIRHSLDIRTS